MGIVLAGLVMAAWAGCHIYGVFLHRWDSLGIAVAAPLIAVQCWLNVGLFIVAHDCMHGSLAPHRPRVNRWIGRVALRLYAGFSYDRLHPSHMLHHRHAGTALDPDFCDAHPDRAVPWFIAFMRRYFSWREFAGLAAISIVYVLVLHAGIANLLLLWALPAMLSAVQLFMFGTYLPHRHADDAFTTDHRARSSGYPWLVSLLTCFHFGYHHEHHAHPSAPWWRLPAVRRAGVG